MSQLAVNLLPATLVERLGHAVLTVCGQQVPATALLQLRPRLRRYLDRRLLIGIRPEDLEDAMVGLPAGAGTAAVLHARVRRVRRVGAGRVVHLDLADDGKRGGRDTTLVATVSDRSSGGVGETMMLAVDTRHLMAIDADSGRRLW